MRTPPPRSTGSTGDSVAQQHRMARSQRAQR